MAERKTTLTGESVQEFIGGVEHGTRQQDARVLVELMGKVSGEKPRMWGPSIIGFGEHHYSLASGKQESICLIGFSPRKSSLSFYLPSFDGKAALLERLGKHRTSTACLYVNKLADVDMEVLEDLIKKSWDAGSSPC